MIALTRNRTGRRSWVLKDEAGAELGSLEPDRGAGSAELRACFAVLFRKHRGPAHRQAGGLGHLTRSGLTADVWCRTGGPGGAGCGARENRLPARESAVA